MILELGYNWYKNYRGLVTSHNFYKGDRINSTSIGYKNGCYISTISEEEKRKHQPFPR
jgi:hypothetical protein